MDKSFGRQAFGAVVSLSLCLSPCLAGSNMEDQDCSLWLCSTSAFTAQACPESRTAAGTGLFFHHLINNRIRVTVNRTPMNSIESLEFGDAFRCVFRAFELTNNNVTYIICLQECVRKFNVDAVIEVANLGHPLLDPVRNEGALLALMEVPDRKSTRLNSSHSQISY